METVKPKKRGGILAGPVAGKAELTILHSNDIHGDFESKEDGAGRKTGGLALLSGYVMRCREKSDNVLYVIAGDMFRGSILDSDTEGLATIALMNAVGPDVVTLGNHEVDYGIEHLLMLEKCADFPVINSNMNISGLGKVRNMFDPVRLFLLNGVRILVIGLLTPEVLEQTRMDPQAGKIIGVTEPLERLQQMYASGRVPKADITILLTHIGLAEDIALARQLDPAWKVDLIIGGHSHDLTEEPVTENGIRIVQAGTGTGRLGRFDIEYGFAQHRINSCKWQAVSIDSETCEADPLVTEILEKGMEEASRINGEVISVFARELTHPDRQHETELGDLYADALKEKTGADIAIIGSGSIRTEQMGPQVTLGDLKVNFPYGDPGYLVKMTGAELREAFRYVLYSVYSPEMTGRLYQLSEGCELVYDADTDTLEKFDLNGVPLEAEKVYNVSVEKFLYENMGNLFGFAAADLANGAESRENTASIQQEIQEYLRERQGLDIAELNRIRVKFSAEAI